MSKVRYTAELKAEAIKQITGCRHGVAEFSKRLGVSDRLDVSDKSAVVCYMDRADTTAVSQRRQDPAGAHQPTWQ